MSTTTPCGNGLVRHTISFRDPPYDGIPHESLFSRDSSDVSFKVENEIIYATSRLLISGSEYFRALLTGSFREAQEISLEAEIPIKGDISANTFKMILEWLQTRDIRALSLLSSTFVELESVYIAADMFLVSDLCIAIERHLVGVMSGSSMKEVFGIAGRVSENLEKAIIEKWISRPEEFDGCDKQIEDMVLGSEDEGMAVYCLMLRG
jgi:hypothetical protein